MKISAMPTGAGGTPGVDLGNIHVGVTASAEKLAAAKALAAGQDPTPQERQDPVERANSVRRITMKTNASPDRFDAQAQDAPPPEGPVGTKPDIDGPTQAAVESTQPLSPQFAALAKQRRELQVMKQELAKERQAMEQAKAEQTADVISKADLLANPLKIFEAGLTYDQLTEAILANQSGMTPEIKALKDELKALKEGVDNKFVSQATIQEESALNQIADDMEALAKDNEAYELFRERKGLERGLSKIYSHYKKTGQVLDLKNVMDQVENQLMDEALKLTKLKKIYAKLAPEQVQTQPQSQGKTMKTLTNRDGASIPLDRRARAVAAFNNSLRK